MIGCSESSGSLEQGSLENASRGESRDTLATDSPVSLLDDDGFEEPQALPPVVTPPATQPDAGPMQAPEADDDAEYDEQPEVENDNSGPGNNNGNNGGNGMSEPMPEPQEPPPPDAGNEDLVGTVCDLLGGLLCPVGLLCVDGLCQLPE